MFGFQGCEIFFYGKASKQDFCCLRRGGQGFLLSALPYDHTARLCRALIGLLFDVHSLPRGKERTKKARPGVPPGDPLGSRRRVAPSGCLCRQASGKDFCARGFQGVLDPLAPFFRHFLRRTKKWHPKPAQRTREAGCASKGATVRNLCKHRLGQTRHSTRNSPRERQ